MGTRSLICVVYRGRFVVAQYSQYDGFPEREGQGMKILKFLLNSANIERLKNGLQHITILSDESFEQLREGVQLHIDGRPSNVSLSKGQCKCAKCEIEEVWPSLSRETGAGIFEIIAQATAEKYVPVLLDLEFANDGLCEWAYVVDLDDCMFEVFAGGELKDKAASKRFASIGGTRDRVPGLLKSFSFTKLPTTEEDFIRILNKVLDGTEGYDRGLLRNGMWRR